MASRGRSSIRVGILVPCALLIFLALGPSASAQYLEPAWVRTFGGAGNDQGWGIDVGPDGEAYVAGFVQGQGLDVFLARLNASGGTDWQVAWTRQFDQKAFEVRYADGFLYVGGVAARTGSASSQDMLLARVWASNGTTDWETTWNGPADLYDEADGIVVEDGLVYVSGWGDARLDFTEGDLALVAFTLNGTYVRHALWGGPGREEGNGALVSDGQTLYVAGIVDGANLFAGGDAVVVAFDQATFAEVWNTTWGGSGVDDAYGIARHADRLYATGLTTSFGGDHIFLLTLDTAGTLLRNVTWGGPAAEAARAVGVRPNGSAVYVAGRTASFGNGSLDVVLIEYDASGAYVSAETWGGSGSDASHGILVASDAIYVVGESSSLGAGGTDLFAMKLGPGTSGPGNPPFDPTPTNPAAVVALLVGVALVVGLIVVASRRRRRSPPRNA